VDSGNRKELETPSRNSYDLLLEHASMRTRGLVAAGAGKGPTGAFRVWRRWLQGLPNPIDDVDRLAGGRFAQRLRRQKQQLIDDKRTAEPRSDGESTDSH
jgi:hypothetical protein